MRTKPRSNGRFVDDPVGGRVPGLVGATVGPVGGSVGVVGTVVTAATALASLVIVTVTTSVALIMKIGGVSLAAPPLSEYVTTTPAGKVDASSRSVHWAPTLADTSGPLPPVPGNDTAVVVDPNAANAHTVVTLHNVVASSLHAGTDYLWH